VVLAVRQRLTRWQAIRYRAQSLMAGRPRAVLPGVASALAVLAAAAATGALMVMLGLVP